MQQPWARQYTGTSGKIDNCQIGVFAAYASSKGRALVDRELYLPKEWASDPARRTEAHVPAQVGFATKPQLAQAILERAVDGQVPAGWVTADEVYGGDARLRAWLEQQDLAYVLAVKETQPLWAAGGQGPADWSVGGAIGEQLFDHGAIGKAEHVVEVALGVLRIAPGMGPAERGDRAALPEQTAQGICQLRGLGECADEEDIQIGRQLLE